MMPKIQTNIHFHKTEVNGQSGESFKNYHLFADGVSHCFRPGIHSTKLLSSLWCTKSTWKN